MIEKIFVLDRPGLFFAFVFLFSGIFSIAYAIPTVRISRRRYYINVIGILLSSLLLSITRNLLLMYILFELITIFSWRIIGVEGEEDKKKDATYMVIFNLVSASFFLLGIARIYAINGVLEEGILKGVSELKLDIPSSILILVGLFTKACVFPFHVWLLRAYRSIFSAAGGIFAGIAELSAVVIFYRVFANVREFYSLFFVLMAIAVFSSILGGVLSWMSEDTRRFLAFSTVSQISFIILGLLLGSSEGIIGAFLLMLSTAIAKPGLFYSIGIMEDYFSTTKIKGIHGFSSISKPLSFGFVLLGFGMAGIPPSLGFFGKLLVLIGIFRISWVIGIAGIISSILTFLYIIRFYTTTFLGKEEEKKRVSGYLVFISVLLGILLILSGIFYRIPYDFLGGML